MKKENSFFFNEKHVKITKRAHALKDYASFYNTEILFSFNAEIEFKDTGSAIRKKLIDLLT